MAGFVVVLFDYRHFGASTGEPRQLLNIARQDSTTTAAVIEWARRPRRDRTPGTGIVLWGTRTLRRGTSFTALLRPPMRRIAAVSRGTSAVHRQHRQTLMCDGQNPPKISPPLCGWRPCVISSEHGWAAHPRLVPALGAPGAFGGPVYDGTRGTNLGLRGSPQSELEVAQ